MYYIESMEGENVGCRNLHSTLGSTKVCLVLPIDLASCMSYTMLVQLALCPSLYYFAHLASLPMHVQLVVVPSVL